MMSYFLKTASLPGIARRHGLDLVIKVEHHFTERKNVLQQHPALVEKDEIFLNSSTVLDREAPMRTCYVYCTTTKRQTPRIT